MRLRFFVEPPTMQGCGTNDLLNLAGYSNILSNYAAEIIDIECKRGSFLK